MADKKQAVQTAEDLDIEVAERRALSAIGYLAAEYVDDLPEGNKVRRLLESSSTFAEPDIACRADREAAAGIANAIKTWAAGMSRDAPYREFALCTARRWEKVAKAPGGSLDDELEQMEREAIEEVATAAQTQANRLPAQSSRRPLLIKIANLSLGLDDIDVEKEQD